MNCKMALALLACASVFVPAGRAADTAPDALLVVAHGAAKGVWNDRVISMAAKIEWDGPKGVAFLTGRTPDEELQAVAAKLDATGARRIVVVPLLVSSFSDHYEELRYYTRARKEKPNHSEHDPLKTRAELILTSAMDSDRLLGRILADQARRESSDPSKESVVLVGHGPNDDVDNERWLACLRVQAGYLQYALGFRKVEVATLRDDAPKPVKDAAVAELRAIVARNAETSKVLIQPVLISSGHLQQEIATLLRGVECTMSNSGVAAHPLAVEWIRQQALTALRTTSLSAQAR